MVCLYKTIISYKIELLIQYLLYNFKISIIKYAGNCIKHMWSFMDYYVASITQSKKQTFDSCPRVPPGVLSQSQPSSSFLNEIVLLDLNFFLSFLYSFITQACIPKHQNVFCLLFVNILFKSFSPTHFLHLHSFENLFCDLFMQEHR